MRSRFTSATRIIAERAVVQRGLAVGELVVGGERIAVEVGERGLRAADRGVARVGERDRASRRSRAGRRDRAGGSPPARIAYRWARESAAGVRRSR